ncbi:MAG: YcaO-like family protein [Bryobacteraceae bacterium]
MVSSVRLIDAFSARTGIVRSLSFLDRGATEPTPPWICNATLANFDFRRAAPMERAAAGKGATEEDARNAAIAEALERYCGFQGRAEAFARTTASEAGDGAISPGRFVLFSDAQYAQPQFPYRRFDPTERIAWVRGHSLCERREVLIPAVFVYLNHFEDRLAPPDSSGLAAGPDLESAILGGLYELIERDAFTVTWMCRRPADRVDVDALSVVDRAIVRHYRLSGIETRVWRLPSDQPAAIMMAASIDRSGNGPAAVVGLGCHLDPAIAARKALFELCQVRPGVPKDAGARFSNPGEVRTLEDHAEYFADASRLSEFDFLDRGGAADLTSRATGSVGGDIRLLSDSLASAGCAVAYTDVTLPDLRDLPIRVARVVAAGLQPIHFGAGMERLGGKRLTCPEADLNPCPHPLA